MIESTGERIKASFRKSGGATIIVSHSDRGDTVVDKKGVATDSWSGEAVRVYDGWFGANSVGLGFESDRSGVGRYTAIGPIKTGTVAIFSCRLAGRTVEGFREKLSPTGALIVRDGGENGLAELGMDLEFAIATAISLGNGDDAETIADNLQMMNLRAYPAGHVNHDDRIHVFRLLDILPTTRYEYKKEKPRNY